MIGPVLEDVRFFRVVLGLRGMKKKIELGQKNIFLFMNPLYELILVFSKFDPLKGLSHEIDFDNIVKN